MPKVNNFFLLDCFKGTLSENKTQFQNSKSTFYFKCFIFQKYVANHKNQENYVWKKIWLNSTMWQNFIWIKYAIQTEESSPPCFKIQKDNLSVTFIHIQQQHRLCGLSTSSSLCPDRDFENQIQQNILTGNHHQNH